MNVANFRVDVIAHLPTTVSLQPIPDDEQLAPGEMALEALEKGDDLGARTAFDELEVDVPEVTPATAESWFQVKLYCRIGV